MNPMDMMDELIDAVSRSAKLPPKQATVAVGSMLRFLAARLPSPLFGELQTRLSLPSPVETDATLDPKSEP